MKTVRYIYWQDENMWLGYLEEFPDYMSQGESFEELQEQLKDIYQELTFGKHSVAGDQKLKRANSPANPGTACRPAEKRSPAGDSSQTDGDVLFPFIPANSCTPDVARQLA